MEEDESEDAIRQRPPDASLPLVPSLYSGAPDKYCFYLGTLLTAQATRIFPLTM
jgi:hypothetical protein